jgi:hypothetical protein
MMNTSRVDCLQSSMHLWTCLSRMDEYVPIVNHHTLRPAHRPPGSSSRSRCMRGKHQEDRARRRRHMLHPGRSFVSFLIPGRWLDRHHRDRRRARAHDDDDARCRVRQKSARPFRFSSPCGKPYGRRAHADPVYLPSSAPSRRIISSGGRANFRRFACRVIRAVPSQAAKPGDRPSQPPTVYRT